jgi:hypothetical protein
MCNSKKYFTGARPLTDDQYLIGRVVGITSASIMFLIGCFMAYRMYHSGRCSCAARTSAGDGTNDSAKTEDNTPKMARNSIRARRYSTKHVDQDGYVFYQDTETGETSWEDPVSPSQWPMLRNSSALDD